MTQTEIQELLTSKGMAVTKNRLNIIQALADNDNFYTITEIVEKVKDINKKSVYNNIKLMITNGIVDSFSFGGVPKYSLNDNLDGRNEIHLVSGQDIDHLDIDESIFNLIEKAVEKETGKEVKTIKIFVDIK